MCGGGTSYDVYWPKEAKPSYPLHNSHIYATVIRHGKRDYFRTEDAIDPRSHWEMDPGEAKYAAFKRIEAKAKRLEARIAKRAFPELHGMRHLPSLWAPWDLPSAEKRVRVRLALPD